MSSLLRFQKSRHLKPRHEHTLAQTEFVDRITRILILGRHLALNDLTFEFSDDILDAVLSKLKLNPNACLSFFKLASKQPTFRPNIKSHCILIHILSRARMHAEARSYLHELAGLCKNNHSCFLVWNELVGVYKEFNFSPTVFDMIMKVYAERGMTKNALYVFDNMGKYGRVPTLRSCNSLLNSLVRTRMSLIAILVYDQMRNRLGIVPDGFTCAIVVNAYCKEGRVDDAVEFVKETERLGFALNVVSCNSLIGGCVSVGDMERAEWVLKLMNEKEILRNRITGTLLIKGYGGQGKVEEAEKVMREMEMEWGEVLDEHVFGALIDGYCRNGRMDDAVRIQGKMINVGLKMNLYVCSSLMNGYCKSGRVSEAERLLTQMGDWDLKPDSYVYSTLMEGYCRGGLMDKAFSVFHEMFKNGTEPNVVTYNTLLKGLFRAGEFEDALSLWNLMLRRGVDHTEVSYCIFLDGLFKMGDFSRALVVWNDILARGFGRSTYALNTLMNGLCKNEKMDEASEIFNRMKELGCKPDSITHRILSNGYCKHGNIEEAFKPK